MNITIWNEFHPSAKEGKVLKVYPEGIHGALKNIFAENQDIKVHTAIQEEPENGLTDKVLDNTDVLVWWGQHWQNNVLESVAEKVCKRVLSGMGIIFLHGAHSSKPFKKLMGTTGSLKWREGDTKERVWTVCPSHPITEGIPETFILESEEMYGEFFDIPTPDELIFLGWYPGGEVIRAGCAFKRGYGKVFYFQPGHETNPSFYNEYVKRIIFNAAVWARPTGTQKKEIYNIKQTEPTEKPKKKLFGKH